MPLYAKYVTKNAAGELVSCHGGDQVWKIGETVSLPNPPAELCRNGTLHALRVRDLLGWFHTHILVGEAGGHIIAGDDKIGCQSFRPIRVSKKDGLDIAVRLAEEAARVAAEAVEEGSAWTPDKVREHLTDWLVAQYEDGFFDGVER